VTRALRVGGDEAATRIGTRSGTFAIDDAWMRATRAEASDMFVGRGRGAASLGLRGVRSRVTLPVFTLKGPPDFQDHGTREVASTEAEHALSSVRLSRSEARVSAPTSPRQRRLPI
jgi:hypothetical protein